MFVYSFVSALVSGLTLVIVGLIVILKNRKSPVNRTFFLMNAAGVIWTLGSAVWLFQKTDFSLSLWAHIFCFGNLILPIFFLHWVLSLLGKIKENKKVLIFGYIIIFLFALTLFSPWYIKGFKQLLPYQPAGPQAGPLFAASLIFGWFGLVGYAFYQLVVNFKKSSGYRKAQIKYVILGIAIGILGGVSNFPLFFGIRVDPWGIPLVAVYSIIYAYAIIKYRLMDIRLVIKRTIVFSIVVLLATIIYVLVTFLFSSLIFNKYSGADGVKSIMLAGLLVSLLVALGVRPLYKSLEEATDRFFFKGEYRSQELIRIIFEKLITSLEINKIQETLVDEIVTAMKLEGGSFFDTQKTIKNLPIENLLGYLNKNREILVFQEMQQQYQYGVKPNEQNLVYQDLQGTDVSVIVPIYAKPILGDKKGKLSALLILKDKKSGDAFTNQDIQTLKIIASQAAIALDNAKMYGEIKQLLNAKTQFVSIVSHQIKNPLAIIKGFASLIGSGVYKKKDQIEEAALRIKETSDRLFGLVNNILDVQRLEAGILQYDSKKINLVKIVKEVVDKYKIVAEGKKLSLEFQPEKGIFCVLGDELKLYQCILNLMDNAIKFTDKGFVRVNLYGQGEKVILEISDSGRGIPFDLLPKLFAKFERGTEQVLTGFGLGLYIIRTFVEAQGGEVWAESEGEGKGSKFFLKLKLAK